MAVVGVGDAGDDGRVRQSLRDGGRDVVRGGPPRLEFRSGLLVRVEDGAVGHRDGDVDGGLGLELNIPPGLDGVVHVLPGLDPCRALGPLEEGCSPDVDGGSIVHQRPVGLDGPAALPAVAPAGLLGGGGGLVGGAQGAEDGGLGGIVKVGRLDGRPCGGQIVTGGGHGGKGRRSASGVIQTGHGLRRFKIYLCINSFKWRVA